MQYKSQIIFIETVVLLFIVLFAYTAANKWMDINNFKLTMGSMPGIKSIGSLTAYTIIILEFSTAGLLIFSRTRLAGLWLSCVLMAAFSIYILTVLLVRANLPCSCGGVLRSMSWSQHLIFNMVFLILAMLATLSYLRMNLFKQTKVDRDV